MSTAPLFTIIIPTHNRASLLNRAIESVRVQSFSNWELLVVDDGSSDETEFVVRSISDPRIHYFKLPHGERSKARNKGVEQATGKYVCFLDDDDAYKEDYLLTFYNYCEYNNYPEVIARIGYYRVAGNKMKKASLYSESRDKNPVRYAAFHFCGVWSLCIPRIFLKDDLFPEAFPHWQDTHLILRLLARHPFVQLPDYQYFYHIHEGMGSRKMREDIEHKLAINLLPIEDLFTHYGKLIHPFLPSYTKKYLLSKKYLEFSQVALAAQNISLSKKYFFTSLQLYFSFSFWKYYIYLCISGLKIVPKLFFKNKFNA